MRIDRSAQVRVSVRAVRLAALATLAAAAMAFAVSPSSASADACPKNPGNSTAWIGGSGNFGEDGAWSNGTPTSACDVVVAPAGSPTINVTNGFNMKSLVVGGSGSTPHLVISVQAPNTNLNATTSGIQIAAGVSITLTCPPAPGECVGGNGGGVSLNAGSSPFQNAGTITIDSNSGTGSTLTGAIFNTGTIQFEQSGVIHGALVNEGAINIADGKVATSSGSSCGDGTDFVRNDTGGTINATGTGTLSVKNYEQGNGSTTGSTPVVVPCGSIKFIGEGASSVRAAGGFNLSGEIQMGQSLTISAESSNTNAVLQSDLTNHGSITLTCPPSPGQCNGGAGGGVGFNANGKEFNNEGTVTISPSSGTGSGFSGGIVNRGTLQFDQDGYLHGAVINEGAINIADGKVATSAGSSCGDGGDFVSNEGGGSINAAGAGTLSVINFQQAAGTTSGVAPVQMPCGSLQYISDAPSTIQVNGGVSMVGAVAAGQTLRILGSVNSDPFTNAGTIVFDQSGTNPTLNAGSVMNTGTIALSGASANTSSVTGGKIEQTGADAEIVIPVGTKLDPGAPIQLDAGIVRGGGTISGSIENDGGVVKPGESLGQLTLAGSYVQGAGGRLEVGVDGTALGQFSQLAIAGNATLGGTVALVPGGAFAAEPTIGDSLPFLTYGGTRSGQFTVTTSTPALACPKQFTVGYDDTLRSANATVSSTGASCGGGSEKPPPAKAPETTLKKKPKATIKTTKGKVKVKFLFTSDAAGAIFECKLDKGSFAACASPKSYSVKKGKHTFSVRATGAGGTDATPATFKFKVVKKKPPPKK